MLFPLRRVIPSWLVGVGVAVAIVQCLSAHGFLHEEIAALSQRIKKQPRNAELLVKRAELYREHRETKEARMDLEQALKIEPSLPSARLALARLLRESGNVEAAKEAVQLVVKQSPGNVEAVAELARCQEVLGEWSGAAASWRSLLDEEEGASPAVALSCARAYGQVKPAELKSAQKVLVQALSRHPRVIVLHRELAALWIRLEQPAKADRQLQALREIYPGLRPRLLVEEASLWQEHHQKERALTAWQEARAAFAKIPAHRQSLPGFQSLKGQIDSALDSPQSHSHP